MSRMLFLAVTLAPLSACGPAPPPAVGDRAEATSDSVQIAEMLRERERAMAAGDVETALAQFADDATWINSQGYYFEGKQEVAKFHGMLAGNDSLGYAYQAGHPRVRLLDARTALAYYSWKMFWYRKANPADTTFTEVGLMTLVARKEDTTWRWVAVTNQHTPDFYERIDPVRID